MACPQDCTETNLCPECCPENDCTPECEECTEPPYTSDGCLNPVDDSCVNYTGPDNACLGITKPLSIKSVFTRIIAYVRTLLAGVNSQSLEITQGIGNCNNSLNIEIVPSNDNSNAFILGTDHRAFVPQIEVVGSQFVTVTPSVVNNKIIYTVSIKTSELSTLICNNCSSGECVAPGDLTINTLK